jgi:hypothetical protein
VSRSAHKFALLTAEIGFRQSEHERQISSNQRARLQVGQRPKESEVIAASRGENTIKQEDWSASEWLRGELPPKLLDAISNRLKV